MVDLPINKYKMLYLKNHLFCTCLIKGQILLYSHDFLVLHEYEEVKVMINGKCEKMSFWSSFQQEEHSILCLSIRTRAPMHAHTHTQRYDWTIIFPLNLKSFVLTLSTIHSLVSTIILFSYHYPSFKILTNTYVKVNRR